MTETETAWAQNSEVIAQSPRDEGWILTLGLGLKNLVLFFSYATPGRAKFCRCCLHFAHRIPKLLLNFLPDPKEMWEPFRSTMLGSPWRGHAHSA